VIEGSKDYLLYLQKELIRAFPKASTNKGNIYVVGGKYGMTRQEIFDLGFQNEEFGNAVFRSDLGGDFMKYTVRRGQGEAAKVIATGMDLAMPLPPILTLARGVRFARGGNSIWTATKSRSGVQNAFSHWKKHGAQFPEYLNAKQYVQGARNFLRKSPSGTLMKRRANGDVLKYHPGTNTFGVMDASGVPRTLFKPTDGMKYWLRQ
jgi:hypothetical protein